MSTSILEQGYIEPDRPYSQKEIQYKRENLFRTLRLGNVRAHHKCCGHFYLVKNNGRKHREIEEKNCEDVGNCSVCWKLNKTPNYLRDDSERLISVYSQMCYEPREIITYENYYLESSFYKWLYEI